MAAKHKGPTEQLKAIREELDEVTRNLSVQKEGPPPLLTIEHVAQRLRTSRAHVARISSLVLRAIQIDEGPRGLRWAPETLEAWLQERQGRGVAA